MPIDALLVAAAWLLTAAPTSSCAGDVAAEGRDHARVVEVHLRHPLGRALLSIWLSASHLAVGRRDLDGPLDLGSCALTAAWDAS
jgi:hypothetical protein